MEQLFKTQFMLVRWQQYISHYCDETMSETDKEILEIELDIVLQINGWLKSFSRVFAIGKTKVPDNLPTIVENTTKDAITFADWKAWREFYDFLRDIGYCLSEDRWIEWLSWYSIIVDWVKKIYPDRVYAQEFLSIKAD